MDLFSRKIGKTKNEWKNFQKHRTHKATLRGQNAPADFQRDEKYHKLSKHIMASFRSNLKNIQSEGRYGMGKAKSLYAPGKSRKLSRQDKTDIEQLKRQKHNDVVTIQHIRIAKAFGSAQKAGNDRFDNIVHGLENEQMEEEQKQSQREMLLPLSAWMEGNAQEDRSLAESYRDGGDNKEQFLTRSVEEVSGYNFSVAMLNETWLENNADQFLKMVFRARSLKTMLEKNPDFAENLSEDVKQLLSFKAEQAEALLSGVQRNFEKNGIELNTEDGSYVVMPKTRAEKDATKTDDITAGFNKLKRKELALSSNLGDLSDNAESAVSNLSFMDFAAMIGTKNRGQITLSGQKLTIINNGRFCSKKGEPSAENMLIRIRFMETALEQLDDRTREAYRPQLMTVLGLYNEKTTESMPLSRDVIASVITEINHMRSKVNRTLSAPDAEKEKPVYKIAEKVNNLLNGFDGGKAKNKAERNVVRDKIKAIVRQGKSLGVGGSSLSEHQMDNILNGNLDLLRDNIFESLRNMDDMIQNLRGNAADNMNWLNDDQLITKIAALEIRRMVQGTEQKPLTAENRLGKLITDTAFELSGKQELKNSFESLYVGNISHDGDRGLLELVESKRKKINRQAYESGTARQEAEEMSLLCDRLQRIAMINQRWLTRNDASYDVDKAELQELGRLVDEALLQENKFQNILPALRGSRFLAGYEEARNKIRTGFRFQNVAGALADQMTRDKTVHADVEVQEVIAQEKHALELSQQEQAVYGALSSEQKSLCDILLMKVPASSIIKENEDDNAKAILHLHSTLRQYQGNEHFIMTLGAGSADLRLEQKKSGILVLSSGNKRITLPLSAARLADELESDMATSIDKYGASNVLPLFPSLDAVMELETREQAEIDAVNAEENQIARAQNVPANHRRSMELREKQSVRRAKVEANSGRVRTMCLAALYKLTGKKASYYNNVPLNNLSDYVHTLLTAKPSKLEAKKQEIFADVAQRDTKVLYNDAEVIEHVLANDVYAAVVVPDARIDLAPEEKKKQKEDEPEWTKEEQQVKNLIADMVFFQSSWHHDEEKKNTLDGDRKGGRLKRVMIHNISAVIKIMDDRSLLDNTIDKMAFPGEENDEVQAGEDNIKNRIKADVNRLFEDPGIVQIQKERSRGATEEDVAFKMNAYFDDKRSDGSINDLEKKIDEDSALIVADVQRELESAADNLFRQPVNQNIPNEFPNPYAKKIDLAEQQRRLALREAELNRRIEAENNSDTGQGKFTKSVLKKYFGASSDEDKRSMVGSMLRFAAQKKNMANMTDEQKQQEKDRRKGSSLAGFLKGSGPLMQKMLQGLPDQGMPEAMKVALGDMKSGLTPIPDEVVRQRLEHLVKRSGNEVTEIKVDRSLGAASVGQAFLCRLFGPSYPQEGKEVVIKLLRPDARNRMVREKKIILDIAREADPSGVMAKTYEKQTEKIEEEFDLTIEEKNLKSGDIYNTPGTGLKSVAGEKALAATVNTLVLEKAPGTTVDSYLKEVDAARKTAKSRRELEKILKTLELRHKHIAQVADKWVTEGIYGSGFYHGDLHAGNIMVDDNGATIIDYGNAIQLSKNQQKEITRLTAAAAVGEVDDFVEAFHNLLENTPKETWTQKRPLFVQEVRQVFAVGGKEITGQMISLLLMRAQAIGLEVPAAINSFSQSQIRLQNTVDGMSATINGIRAQLDQMDKQAVEKPLMDITALCQHDYVSGNKDGDATLKEYATRFFSDRNALFKDMRLKDRKSRDKFKKKWTDTLPEGELKENFKNALAALKDSQDGNRGDLAAREEAVAKAYEAAFAEKRKNMPEVQEMRQNLLSNDPEVMQKIDAELKEWFEDKENYGNELKDAYDSFRKAVAENAPEQERNAIADLFFTQYFEAAEVRLNTIRRQRQNSRVPVKNFFDVMGDVTERHLKASINMLGFWKGTRYRGKLDDRATKTAPRQAAGQEEKLQDDDAKMADVRSDISKMNTEEMPATLSKARKQRGRLEHFDQKIATIIAETKKRAKENGAYVKNLKAERESREEREQNKATKAMDIWANVKADFIDNANDSWLTQSELEQQQAGNQVENPVVVGIFNNLTAALQQDFDLIESKQDAMERYNMEKNLRHILVDLARDNGGAEYFTNIAKGAAKEGGKLAKFNILNHRIDEEHTSKTAEFLDSLSELNSEDQKKAAEAVGALLMLFGERMEKSYLAREKAYDEENRERKHKARVLHRLRSDRFNSYNDYLNYIDAETEKLDFAEEHKGEEGRTAYVSMLKGKGWISPQDEILFGALQKWVSEDVNSQAPDKRDRIRIFLVDLQNRELKTWEDRRVSMGVLRKLIDEYDESPQQEQMMELYENAAKAVHGKVGFWRLKNGKMDKVGENHPQTGILLARKAHDNYWANIDEPGIDAFVTLLEKAYDHANLDESEEDRRKAKEIVDKLEEVADIFENKLLTSEKMRTDTVAKICNVFEGQDSLYGINREGFERFRYRVLYDDDLRLIADGAAEQLERDRQAQEEQERIEQEQEDQNVEAEKEQERKEYMEAMKEAIENGEIDEDRVEELLGQNDITLEQFEEFFGRKINA